MIHIVDDEEDVRTSLASVVEVFGYAVSTYASGDTFLVTASPQAGDIVLLDVRMPGRSGIEVLRELRKRRTQASVIIMTGHATSELLLASEEEELLGFLEKPFEIPALLELIRKGS